ncbi:MAG TPA: hypothetical protein PKY77_23220 [Phycisphaerae bacterium]|nr:hypothetical protein [Phycisphaerae bacterium]HRY71533.1 hypothetical protein [Phycisphaerae bacterium]
MKTVLGDHLLAIASGITPQNVRHYLGIAGCFLVVTGISLDFSSLDAGKLRDLMRVVQAADAGTLE